MIFLEMKLTEICNEILKNLEKADLSIKWAAKPE